MCFFNLMLIIGGLTGVSKVYRTWFRRIILHQSLFHQIAERNLFEFIVFSDLIRNSIKFMMLPYNLWYVFQGNKQRYSYVFDGVCLMWDDRLIRSLNKLGWSLFGLLGNNSSLLDLNLLDILAEARLNGGDDVGLISLESVEVSAPSDLELGDPGVLLHEDSYIK